jgi:hypothetical protein
LILKSAGRYLRRTALENYQIVTIKIILYLLGMIAMPNLIPDEQRNALSLAITRGDAHQVRYLVEQYDLDANAFLDDSPTCMPVLMDALLSNGFPTEDDRLTLLRYLLEKGANPNIYCRKGYNCLHVAVQQDKFIKALDLFLDHNADVNVPDADGANIVYWAIQGFLLRKTAEVDREQHLRVLEKILLLGADLDQRTRYDMNAREWLEHAAPEVRDLVARREEGKPSVRPVTTVQPKFPSHLQYPAIARKIWRESGAGLPSAASPNAAPSSDATLPANPRTELPLLSSDAPASSPSIAGQLLTAVETLREEAQQHGNAAYGKRHKKMALFVRDTLVKSGVFDKATIDRIRSSTAVLMKASKPYLQDDLYDQLVDLICVFYIQRSAPVMEV